ncbi:MAG: hypothetical protein QXR57_00600 [Metallosphaera sp.]|uniref:hypothetical protein n=1 Tax=Metallosphaera sp. TaxID=2020860 RepID=UPI003166E6D5
MKWKVWYAIIFGISIIVSSYISPLWSVAFSLSVLYRKRLFIVAETVSLLLSFFIVSAFRDVSIYVYIMRAFTFINVFLAFSEHLDRVSIISLLGEKGIPLVITLSYVPFFYELSTNVFFYRRSRRRRFNVEELARPILVEMIRVAENLYKAYTLKLYGNFKRKIEINPSIQDLVAIGIGVVALCLSLTIPIYPVK